MFLCASFAVVLCAVSPPTENPTTIQTRMLAKAALKHAGEARAAAPLLRLHALLDDVEDVNILTRVYARVRRDRQALPQVRTLARFLEADVERSRGRMVKAERLLRPVGLIRKWWVVGAFENESKAGCAVDYGPESATELQATYKTATREVSWHKLAATHLDGYVNLALALQPTNAAVGYALTFLQAEKPMPAVLSFGTAGAHRLYLNDMLVASSDEYTAPQLGQHRVQVQLRRGINRLMLKVCQDLGPFGFYFAASKVDSVRDGFQVVLPEKVPPLVKGPPARPEALLTLQASLERQLQAAPDDTALRTDYATVLSWTRAYPRERHAPAEEAKRATMQGPVNAALLLNAGLLQQHDMNERRRLIEAALQHTPTHPWATAALAQHALDMQHPTAALRHAKRLLKAHPRFAPAHLLQIKALEALEDAVGAWRAAEKAFAKLPYIPSVARKAAALAQQRGQLQEATQRYYMVLGLRYDDTDTRRVLANLLTEMGRIEEAMTQYEKLLALTPSSLNTLLKCAQLSAANGNMDTAQARLRRAQTLAPAAPHVYEAQGRVRLYAGQRTAAQEAFEYALKLKPQNPKLKDRLRVLRGDYDNTSPEAFPAEVFMEALGEATSPEDAVILSDVTHVKVQPSGVAARFHQLAVKVLTPRGVERFRRLPIVWAPARQEVQVLKARTTKADGSVVDSFTARDSNINQPWTGMYYDTRARILTFPALAQGDVLEVQWRLEDINVDNLLSNYWGDVATVQDMYPKRRYRYVVEMPHTRPLYWNAKTLPSWLKASQKREGTKTVYRFEASQLPKITPEPHMPGWAEVATALHLSTYRSWEAVGRYYWNLVKGQLVRNGTLDEVVDETLKDINREDIEATVAALYSFVVRNTRYVALEFGIHGYKPYSVERVLSRRFGDCKDKAALMYALLAKVGIDSRLVLVRTRPQGLLAGEVASLSAFNHAILYVPKLQRFLDGTAEYHGSRELPVEDRLANALIIEPHDASRWLTIPEETYDENPSTLEMTVSLQADGSAQVHGRFETRGHEAARLRRVYETQATQLSTFERLWRKLFPGMRVKKLAVSPVHRLEAPLKLQFSAVVPHYAETGVATLRFYPFAETLTFTHAFAPLAHRKYDVLISGVGISRLSFTYHIPAGWTAQRIPQPVTETSKWGALHMHAQRDAQKLHVEAVLKFEKSRISVQEYKAFRAWLMRVDKALTRKVVLQHEEKSAM